MRKILIVDRKSEVIKVIAFYPEEKQLDCNEEKIYADRGYLHTCQQNKDWDLVFIEIEN
jgi:hypothetical protein